MRAGMQNKIVLKDKLASSLPPDALDFIKKAAAMAHGQNGRLYLVGGVVRDILLGKCSYDIDLTVEGDATLLAEKLTGSEGTVELHPQFGTAKIVLPGGIGVDIAGARKETYARPGALPSVSPGTISDDLFRRDFTVNAMAIALSPQNYGELIDLYGGLFDLENKLIRVLHDKSFTHDATRIWRAIRYSERLDFAIEAHTRELLKRDVSYLDTVSGDRIRYELECVMGEDYPGKAIRRAGELDVLKKLNPHLSGDGILAARFRRARELSELEKPPFALYTALLTYPLNGEEIEQFTLYLRLDRTVSRVLRDACELRSKAGFLGDPSLTPTQVYHLLHGCSPLAIETIYIESNNTTVWQHIDFYTNVLRNVKPLLTGKELQNMGVPEGPEIRKILGMLLDARLNGEITAKEDEEKIVRKWVGEKL